MIGSVPKQISGRIEAVLNTRITGFAFASGGCINRGGKLSTTSGPYFLKWNDASEYPQMFAAEARGLALLRAAGALAVPAPVDQGKAGEWQYLLLEFVEEGRQSIDYWRRLGTGLATLHRKTAEVFGLDHGNYIGALPQRNDQDTSWTRFFIECRLRPQLDIARRASRMDASDGRKFETLFAKLDSLLDPGTPSMLHGDLWSGNVITEQHGYPCIIDPAVYYGHREVDLAMTQLFGGFGREFLESYQEAYPLLPGYVERFDIYNLYPLLVHLNLFGAGYKRQVVSILNRFV